MTKPKPMPQADMRVYTQGTVRAIVQEQGTADSYKVRCTIMTQQPDGTWRT